MFRAPAGSFGIFDPKRFLQDEDHKKPDLDAKSKSCQQFCLKPDELKIRDQMEKDNAAKQAQILEIMKQIEKNKNQLNKLINVNDEEIEKLLKDHICIRSGWFNEHKLSAIVNRDMGYLTISVEALEDEREDIHNLFRKLLPKIKTTSTTKNKNVEIYLTLRDRDMLVEALTNTEKLEVRVSNPSLRENCG